MGYIVHELALYRNSRKEKRARVLAGFAPYEKRTTELFKVGRDKRTLKVAERKLGTHKSAKREREEMFSVLCKMSGGGATTEKKI
ncbi:hypothetical protein Bca52824_003098 [Brassica carinata]|uniref:60S ribosomal protein L36 n=1 Tax=Brassica carinata TaxID=52824 RepID=A0A8X7WPM2_BRACI|nr:hypothetical protein Bca52824_003098 [Brassica carinata]